MESVGSATWGHTHFPWPCWQHPINYKIKQIDSIILPYSYPFNWKWPCFTALFWNVHCSRVIIIAGRQNPVVEKMIYLWGMTVAKTGHRIRGITAIDMERVKKKWDLLHEKNHFLYMRWSTTKDWLATTTDWKLGRLKIQGLMRI